MEGGRVATERCVASGVLLDLRLPQVEKKEKNLPKFGRDLVARGSSGLKLLRHRAPHVYQNTRV